MRQPFHVITYRLVGGGETSAVDLFAELRGGLVAARMFNSRAEAILADAERSHLPRKAGPECFSAPPTS